MGGAIKLILITSNSRPCINHIGKNRFEIIIILWRFKLHLSFSFSEMLGHEVAALGGISSTHGGDDIDMVIIDAKQMARRFVEGEGEGGLCNQLTQQLLDWAIAGNAGKLDMELTSQANSAAAIA